MRGFILETLAGRSWRREGMTYWTQEDAMREAKRVLRRGKAVEVRILRINIEADPVESMSAAVDSEQGEESDV